MNYKPTIRSGVLRPISWFEDELFSSLKDWTNYDLKSAYDRHHHNLKEEDNYYHLTLDVPGINPKDIAISVSHREVSIASSNEKSRNFSTTFTLPDSADVDHIEANCNHGVLDVVLPKMQIQKQNRISIKSEDACSFLSKVKKGIEKISH